jgi:hypothetical protein
MIDLPPHDVRFRPRAPDSQRGRAHAIWPLSSAPGGHNRSLTEPVCEGGDHSGRCGGNHSGYCCGLGVGVGAGEMHPGEGCSTVSDALMKRSLTKSVVRPIPFQFAPGVAWSSLRREPGGGTVAVRLAAAFVGPLALLVLLVTIGRSLLGLDFIVVHDGGMAPAIGSGSLAVVHNVDSKEARVGDIVSVSRTGNGGNTVTRVAAISPDGILTLKGDANEAPGAAQVPISDVHGRYLFSIPETGRYVIFVLLLAPGLVTLGYRAIELARRRSNPTSADEPRRDAVQHLSRGRRPWRQHRVADDADLTRAIARRLSDLPRPRRGSVAGESEAVLLQSGLDAAASELSGPSAAPATFEATEDFGAIGAPEEFQGSVQLAGVAPVVESADEIGETDAFDDAASVFKLEPSVLVSALNESHRRNAVIERRIARYRALARATRKRIRMLDTNKASTAARLESMERLIAALHDNVEDLRVRRDA